MRNDYREPPAFPPVYEKEKFQKAALDALDAFASDDWCASIAITLPIEAR